MENTRSKITVNLYGNKYQAVMPYSDPTLDELVSAFVGLLEEHDFNVKDIHEAFVHHLVLTIKELDYKDTDIADELFFDLATRKKTNK